MKQIRKSLVLGISLLSLLSVSGIKNNQDNPIDQSKEDNVKRANDSSSSDNVDALTARKDHSIIKRDLFKLHFQYDWAGTPNLFTLDKVTNLIGSDDISNCLQYGSRDGNPFTTTTEDYYLSLDFNKIIKVYGDNYPYIGIDVSNAYIRGHYWYTLGKNQDQYLSKYEVNDVVNSYVSSTSILNKSPNVEFVFTPNSDAVDMEYSDNFDVTIYQYAINVVDSLSNTTTNVNVDCDSLVNDDWKDVVKNNITNAFGQNVKVTYTQSDFDKITKALGSWKIPVTLSDDYGNTASAFVNLSIVDTKAPSIALNYGMDLSFNIGDILSIDGSNGSININDYFTITDNGTAFGGSINTPSFYLDGKQITSSDPITIIENMAGNHSLKVTCSDSSNNSTGDRIFTLKVKDTIKPVISRKDKGEDDLIAGLSRTLSLTKEDFLSLFEANDNVDGDVSSTLNIDGEFNIKSVGIHTLTLTAKDRSNNVATYDVKVDVRSDLPPVFILSNQLIQATTDQPLSSDQIKKVIANAFHVQDNLDPSDIYLSDIEYQSNRSKVGSYVVSYSYKPIKEDGGYSDPVNEKFTIDVKKPSNSKDETSKSFLDRCAEFFQRIGNWFRGVFTKFKFDCFITNEEWNERFGG